MDDKQTTLPIEPYKAYSLKQAAAHVGIKDPKTIYKLKLPQEFKAKKVGNAWIVLGENILSYLGSPTILNQQMQPNTKLKQDK